MGGKYPSLWQEVSSFGYFVHMVLLISLINVTFRLFGENENDENVIFLLFDEIGDWSRRV